MSEETKRADESEETKVDDTENKEQELYDSVSAAIDEHVIDDEPENKNDENTDDDPSETTDPTDGDEGAGKPDGDNAEPESEGGGDTEESEKGSEKDEEGGADDAESDKDESGDGAEKDAGGEGDAKKEGDDDAKEPDPINDPIPESTAEKTRDRIQSLIGIIKEKEGAEQQRDEIVQEITATGADPEQYAASLGFLKLFNSENVEERKKALQIARGMVRELALDVGEGATVTSLDEYDDLKAEVEAGTLTEERALEIAAGREREKLQQARSEQQNQKSQATEQTKRNIETGRTQLNDLEEQIRAQYKDYDERIRPTFVSLLKPVLKRTHPTEWGEAAKDVFRQVVNLAPAASTASKPKPKPANEPLRPKGSSGGSGKASEASSAVAAIDEALGNMP